MAGPDVVAALPGVSAEIVFDALAQRAGTRVLFEAASRVCAPRLVARMNALAAQREAAGDRSSVLVSLVGDITIEAFFRIDNEGTEETRVALVTRPKQKRPQFLVLARDRRLPGRPLRLGQLTEPLSSRKVDQIFADMRAERELPVPANVDEFPAWLVEAASASAELQLGPTADAAEVAVQLLRQAGEPELADRISLLFPLELDYDEAGDELDDELRDTLVEEVDEVVEEFEEWLSEHAPGLDEGAIALVAQDVELAFEFQVNILGGEAGGPWTDEELDAFLLSWVPAKVTTTDDDRARMPVSLEYLFRFLGDSGDLVPPAAEKLARRSLALSQTFAQRASDPTRRGGSGALVAAMLEEGVDVTDAGAVDAWMNEFNERPFEERDAILGMSLPSPPDYKDE